MSRHLWNASRPKPDHSPRQAEPLGIFAATIRAVTGRPGPEELRPGPRPAAVPVPRPAREHVEPPGPEEITEEIPRYSELEPSEPALSMLSRGRHGTA